MNEMESPQLIERCGPEQTSGGLGERISCVEGLVMRMKDEWAGGKASSPCRVCLGPRERSEITSEI